MRERTKELIFLVLSIILIGTGTIICLSNKPKQIEKTPTTTTTVTTTTTTTTVRKTNNIETIFNSLPTSNDNNILFNDSIYKLTEEEIDFNTNFKNKNLEKYGYNLTFNCTYYNRYQTSEDQYKCEEFKIKINNDYEINMDHEYPRIFMLTNDYIISYEGAFSGNMIIINKLGEEVYKDYIATDFIVKTEDNEYLDNIDSYYPIIKDNELNYIRYNKYSKAFTISKLDLNTLTRTDKIDFKGEIGIM